MNYEDIVCEWKKKKLKTKSDYITELENFQILFAYNSNKIENPTTTYHDTREIFQNGRVQNYSGDLRTLFEIQNQKDCFDFLLEKIIAREELSEELIKEIHKRLMKGCYDEHRFEKGERPGEYKKGDYVVGDDIGIFAEDVSEEMSGLLDEINGYSGDDILKAASYFHLSFEAIHPFADGNGRVGRALLNYYFLIHDYPPIIIYEDEKKVYYMALTVFDKTGKIDGFMEYLKEQAVRTWTRKRSIPKLSESQETQEEITRNRSQNNKMHPYEIKPHK